SLHLLFSISPSLRLSISPSIHLSISPSLYPFGFQPTANTTLSHPSLPLSFSLSLVFSTSLSFSFLSAYRQHPLPLLISPPHFFVCVCVCVCVCVYIYICVCVCVCVCVKKIGRASCGG